MNNRIVFVAFLATALFLVPGKSNARLLNVDTGRFITMDIFEGDQQNPQSLHKYAYAADDPVDNDDPSGEDFEALDVGNIGSGLDAMILPVFAAVIADVKAPLRDWPNTQRKRLLAATIFAESTAGQGRDDAVEKVGIGATLYNDIYYATLPPGNKQKRNYNAAAFGDGTIVGALKMAFKPSYLKTRWNLVAGPLDLKPQATLDSVLIAGDRGHYNLWVDAANTITYPMNVPQLNNERPIGFNKASDRPPNTDREHKIGNAGLTTFYGFDQGREYQ
jgi:hypothetical protein